MAAYVFLDADCLPGLGWLDAYRDVDPAGVTMLFGSTEHERADGTVDEDPRVHDRGALRRREVSLFERGGGGNMLVTAAAFDTVGVFETSYDGGFGWEETDYAVRVYQAGGDVLYEPRAGVTHLYHPRGRDHYANIERNRKVFMSRTRLFAGSRT
jgi:GT2 family glycosyltransferase